MGRRIAGGLFVVALLLTVAGTAQADPLTASASRRQTMYYRYDRLVTDSQGSWLEMRQIDLSVTITTGTGGPIATATGYLSRFPFTQAGEYASYWFPPQDLNIGDVVAAPAGNSWSISATLLDSDGLSWPLNLDLTRPGLMQFITPSIQYPGVNAWVDPAGAVGASWRPESGVLRSNYVATGNLGAFDLDSDGSVCQCLGGAAYTFDGVGVVADATVG